MPRITYLNDDGGRQDLEIDIGSTVMEGAVDNNVPGIVAECGGACACATCHAYIDDAWLERLPPMSEMEDAMLDSALERRPNSRLSCQLEVTAELDGLIVHVANNEV
jgi:2Fe-2S ferredoxin